MCYHQQESIYVCLRACVWLSCMILEVFSTDNQCDYRYLLCFYLQMLTPDLSMLLTYHQWNDADRSPNVDPLTCHCYCYADSDSVMLSKQLTHNRRDECESWDATWWSYVTSNIVLAKQSVKAFLHFRAYVGVCYDQSQHESLGVLRWYNSHHLVSHLSPHNHHTFHIYT